MIQNEKGVLIKTDLEFWDDSLFCEWAYVVDLDAKTLSVYTNGKTLVKEWAFAALPSNEEFCDALGE